MLIKSKIFQVSIMLGLICVLGAIGRFASDVMAADKEIIMEEDFEPVDWFLQWSFIGNPSWHRQLYSSETCISTLSDGGSWNAWCAKKSIPQLWACDDDYPNNCDSWLIRGPFNLSGQVGEVKVEFDLWNKSATGDYFKCMASTSITPLSDFQALYQTQSEIEWEHIKLALDGDTGPDIDNNVGNPDFRGQSQVWIAFVFQSNESNTDIGAFIDNIELWKQTGSPQIEVTPSPYDYGKVIVGSCSENTFTVKNVGSGELEVTQIKLENSTGGFNIVASPTVPFTLNPGGTQTVTVDFCPQSPGGRSCDLCFDSNDLEDQHYCVPLTGTGATPTDIPFHVTPTNRWMNFRGSAAILGVPVEVGDMIGAFALGVEINNSCVGVFEVTTPGVYGQMTVYGDDSTTPEKDGAAEGDEITFKIWDFDFSDSQIYDAIPKGPDDSIWHQDSNNNVDLDSLPSPPPDFLGTASNERVDLQWGFVSEAQGYRVYRSLNNVDYSPLADVNRWTQTYADTDVDNGITYYYRVKSYVGLLESFFSPMVQLTPPFSFEITNSSALLKGNAYIGTVPAAAGDILAAFVALDDSLLCVATYEFPLSDGKYNLMWVYGDNPSTPQKDGAEEGDQLVFQLWNASADAILVDVESDPAVVSWHEDTTSDVDLYFDSDAPPNFNLHLCENWNLISFPVAKCHYEGTPPDTAILPQGVDLVNVNDLGFESLADWLTSVLTADCGPFGDENPPWRMVISGLPGGEAKVMDSEVPAAFHTLKFMSPGYAYWVKMKAGSCGGTLTLEGESLPCNTPLDYLKAGWNYLGYLPDVGYYDSSIPNEECLYVTPQVWEEKTNPVAEDVLESISGKYRIVQGACCGGAALVYDPTIQPHFSTLHFFTVGNGYVIKLTEDATLTYPCDAVSSTTTVARRLVGSPPAQDGVRPTDQMMFLYGTVSIDGKPAKPGSRIRVFTPSGLPCAFGKVIKPGVFAFLPIYADDATTPEIDGARPGEDLLLKVNGKTATVNGGDASGARQLQWLGQHAVAKVELTVTSNPRPTTVAVGQNHPNPFNPETWIPFKLSEAAAVTVQIYSMNGQMVRTLKLGRQNAGVYQTKGRAAYWDGRNENGEKVSSGVYFYRLNAGTMSQTKRMVLIK